MARKPKLKAGEPLFIMDCNGEIIAEFNEGDKIKIIKKSQTEYLAKYDVNFGKGESFLKMFTENIDVIKKNLTDVEIAFIFKISPYISYKDGILRHNGRILNTQLIAELEGYSYKTIRKIITSLISKGVLGEHKTGSILNKNVITKCITFNPYIFCRGTEMNNAIISFYEKSGWNKINQ